jgi:hypothetical protein
MAITKQDIENMQQYYFANYGQGLTEEEAEIMLINLRNFFEIIEEKRAFEEIFGASEE